MWVEGPMGTDIVKRRTRRNAIRFAVERFLKKNISPKQLQKMFDQLPVKDQFTLILHLLPYCMAKQNPQSEFEKMDDQQVNELTEQIKETINSKLKIIPFETEQKGEAD